MTDECFLCNYNAWPVDDLPPRERVFSNDYWRVLVHQSAIPGWLVVGLRRHVARLSDLTEEETISLGPALSAGTQALIDVVGCAKTYAMLFSESVAHVHFNLVPRMADMPDKFRGAGIFGYNVVATPLDEAARDDLGRRLATAWPVHKQPPPSGAKSRAVAWYLPSTQARTKGYPWTVGAASWQRSTT